MAKAKGVRARAKPVTVCSRTKGWTVDRPPAGVGVLRGAEVFGSDVPDYLVEGPFEVVDRVVARQTAPAAALRGESAQPLQIEVMGREATASYIAIARHASGALTIHLPDGPGSAARGVRKEPLGQGAVQFTIPVRSSDSAGVALRGIGSRIVRIVVTKVVDKLAGAVVAFAGRKLEQQLWRRAKLEEGWVRIVQDASGGSAIRHEQPSLPAGARGLLFIHGTFSNTHAAFKDLLRGQALRDLDTMYSSRIYGFEHFTFSKSVDENVSDLLAGMPNGPAMTLDVITHSRGALVLRALMRELARRKSLAPISLGRIVIVAAPNEGTPLATPARWESTLGWFANLMEIFPDNPFTTAAGWISGGLSWIAQRLAGDLPGLSSMDMRGSLVHELANVASPEGVEWYALVSNFRASDEKLAARLLDMSVDRFFTMDNDLVVPTEGGWHLGNRAPTSVPADRVGCYGLGGNLRSGITDLVNHVTFFKPPETTQFVMKALKGDPLGLPAVRAGLPLRGGLTVETERDAVPTEQLTLDDNAGFTRGTPRRVFPMLRPDDAWDRQDSLNLVVLPAPQPEEPTPGMQAGERKPRKRPDAQLLASYGGARVLAPFRLSGREDDAGGRWQKIIAGHKDINSFVEGTLLRELTLEDIQSYGAVMFETLFREDVRRLYDQARFRDAKRKLNVVFTSMVPWVAELPWEFAFDKSCEAFLATSDVRFVRNVLTPVPADRIARRGDGPLRILVVSAQPRSAAALSLNEERELIKSAFRSLIDYGAVRVDVLAEATPDLFHARVRDSAEGEFDVIHFMGHGRFDEDSETGYLLFEDRKGNVQELSTSHMKDILRGRGIKLVFLNACQTGRGASADYNKGVAPGLVKDGVPAVVANQYSVLDRSATTFARHFYWSLAQGLSLGDAAREARIALNYSGGGLIGWAVPVLFARDPDAVLCPRQDIRMVEDPEGRDARPAPSEPFEEVVGKVSLDEWTLPLARAKPARHPTSLPDEALRSSSRALTVGIWDVNDAVPELRELVERMNQAQDGIEFRVVTQTAPYGLWKVDPGRFESTAYLPAERTAKRMTKFVAATQCDYLVGVTDLPLADNTTKNLYLWYGDGGSNPELADNRLIIFSTWGFQPPLRGPTLQRALVNVTVEAVAGLMLEADLPDDRPGTIGYYNDERDVTQVAGTLRVGAANRKQLVNALNRKQLPALRIADALESLLSLFGTQHEHVPAEAPAKKVQKVKRRVIRKATRPLKVAKVKRSVARKR